MSSKSNKGQFSVPFNPGGTTLRSGGEVAVHLRTRAPYRTRVNAADRRCRGAPLCGVPFTVVTSVTTFLARGCGPTVVGTHERRLLCLWCGPKGVPRICGDRGDIGDPDASYCRTSLKEAYPSLEMRDDTGHEHRQRKCANVRCRSRI